MTRAVALNTGARTDWFPPEVKPVRRGVYERDLMQVFPWKVRYSWWNGKAWCGWAETVDAAYCNRQRGVSSIQSAAWRGLARKPK
jgi:hypothetical protein